MLIIFNVDGPVVVMALNPDSSDAPPYKYEEESARASKTSLDLSASVLVVSSGYPSSL